MSYHITLDVFEGPLDLLLHLIQKQKLDIYDIPIAQITEQYLAYLSAMQQLDLEVASEFLVMAATLLAIKAKMLLPRKAAEPEEAGEEPEDPREELVQRLVEYQKFKEAASLLKNKEVRQAQVFFRPLDQEILEKALKQINPLENVHLNDLLGALQKVLAEAPQEETHEISKEEITIVDKMDYISKLLEREQGGVIFQNLFPPGTSRLEIVITFLALLELIRLQKAAVNQSSSYGPLWIYPKVWQEEEGRVV
ncbi:segregation and condensation protein A [Zhaonella formicivorans]|uniref:segregation and condensation protein A n=1 Tax=Zhaonella formicivorans TaxID=2528593 RepID=UPI0010EA0214|nr:segregation/condensation protein A [Zhaonella formicivorans]